MRGDPWPEMLRRLLRRLPSGRDFIHHRRVELPTALALQMGWFDRSMSATDARWLGEINDTPRNNRSDHTGPSAGRRDEDQVSTPSRRDNAAIGKTDRRCWDFRHQCPRLLDGRHA